MTHPIFLELERAVGEAVRQVLARPAQSLGVKESVLLLGQVVKMAQRGEFIGTLPYQLLVEAGGMEGTELATLCRSALEVVRVDLDMLDRVAILARETADVHGAPPPDLTALEACRQALLQAKAQNEELLARATAPRRPVDWERVQQAEESLARGEGTRYAPKSSKG